MWRPWQAYFDALEDLATWRCPPVGIALGRGSCLPLLYSNDGEFQTSPSEDFSPSDPVTYLTLSEDSRKPRQSLLGPERRQQSDRGIRFEVWRLQTIPLSTTRPDLHGLKKSQGFYSCLLRQVNRQKHSSSSVSSGWERPQLDRIWQLKWVPRSSYVRRQKRDD